MQEIKIGIIGCGGIAGAHKKGYLANQAKIVAITDINRSAAEKFGQDLPGAKIFASAGELVASGQVEAISVCTPPASHEEAVLQALARGIHVLCEKPLAHTTGSAQQIARAAKKSKGLLMTAFRHRFLPAMVKVKELISSGEIGEPVMFHNIFCGPAFDMDKKWFSKKKIAGGGTLMDTSSHSIDLFRFLIGEVTEQKAVMHRHLTTTNVEDASILIVKSARGVVGSISATWVAGDGVAFVDVIGTKGHVRYDYLVPDQVQMKTLIAKTWQNFPVTSSGGFTEEIAHFLAAIQGSAPLACTGQDGLRAVEIIQDVYKQK
jgi:predicted dehydrogenase